MFGEGSLIHMPLAGCSLTWPALLFGGFFSIQLTTEFYSTVAEQMQLFQLKYEQENPCCCDKHWADHHFLQESKMTLPAAVSYFTRLTQKCAMYWVTHTASCSACFPSSLSLSSSLLANFHSNYQASLFLPNSKMGWVPEKILTIEIHKTLKSREVFASPVDSADAEVVFYHVLKENLPGSCFSIISMFFLSI